MSSDERDDWVDPVIEAYKPGIDETLIIERLKRSVEERLRDGMAMQRWSEELRRAGARALHE